MSDDYTPTDDMMRHLLHVYADHLSPEEVDRYLAERDRQVVELAKAEVGTRFAEWAFKNEIAEAPLDWKWFGEIVRWTGSPVYEHDAVCADDPYEAGDES